jgi:hypothetical protein
MNSLTKMKIITPGEAAEWCKSHAIGLSSWGLPDVRNRDNAGEFSIPGDAGKRTWLVKEQMESLKTSPSILVWLADWCVWPSGQWDHLFERFRKSYGCEDPLITKPAHLIPQSEFDAAVSIAVYSVLMLWDCYIVTESGKWIYYSHDEWGSRGELSLSKEPDKKP